MFMSTDIVSDECPDWKASQPVSAWPDRLCMKIAMEGAPAQRRHLRFFSLPLPKEAGGDPSRVDDIRRWPKEWRPTRPTPHTEGRDAA
jgi:hypothetical protein